MEVHAISHITVGHHQCRFCNKTDSDATLSLSVLYETDSDVADSTYFNACMRVAIKVITYEKNSNPVIFT